MIEIAALRKNKICLSDYDYKKDIKNRKLLFTLCELELKVLEELLFSSIKTSISKLTKDLNIQEKKLLSILYKFQNVNLLKIDTEIIIIDKKMRKYFEFEYMRFDPNFKPDLQFINNLLQKIPIHILPIWYSLPKTSNYIFISIIDKYLLTPQIFQRYLENLKNENPIFYNIIEDLYNSENFEISANEIQQKYNLKKDKYLEYLLLLEFNFICFQSYKKTKNGYEEILTPFYEYKKYLQYFYKTTVVSIKNTEKLIRKRNSDFGFIEDLTSILKMAKKNISISEIEQSIKKELNLKDPNIIISNLYINNLINKLLQINFVTKKQNFLKINSSASKWLELSQDQRALHLYYHPLNLPNNLPNKLSTEKSVREAEKSIARIIKKGWVYFDNFIKGLTIPITDKHQIKIKAFGKVYKYLIPSYTKDEISFIKKIIFERLFETGIVSVGSLNGKDCFCVTKFGETLFDIV
jgi:hypothetical protein